MLVSENTDCFFIENGFSAVAVDGAALFEAGADGLCDRVLCVLAPQNVRFDRILSRDRIEKFRAELRIRAQKDDAFYSDRADAAIVNDGDVTVLHEKINHILKEWYHE